MPCRALARSVARQFPSAAPRAASTLCRHRAGEHPSAAPVLRQTPPSALSCNRSLSFLDCIVATSRQIPSEARPQPFTSQNSKVVCAGGIPRVETPATPPPACPLRAFRASTSRSSTPCTRREVPRAHSSPIPAMAPGGASDSAKLPLVMDSSNLEGFLDTLRELVPELTDSKHKGQAGRVAVVGGCREYTGAPFFSSISALRLGADLSHVICSRDAAPVIKSYSPELIVHPLLKESYELDGVQGEDRARLVSQVVGEVSYWVQRMDCIVVGPGLGRDPFLMDCVAGIMMSARDNSVPMVIDADGLFLVNSRLDLVKGYPRAILTPNVVELKRLQDSLANGEGGGGQAGGSAGRAALPSADEDSASALQDMAARLGNVTLVQKGKADTITDGCSTVQVAVYGSPRRCGGQGDILAGSMAAMLAWAQRWAEEGDGASGVEQAGVPSGLRGKVSGNSGVVAAAAACVVVRHAAASVFAARKRSMVTGDIINQLGDSMEALFPVGPWESEPKL